MPTDPSRQRESARATGHPAYSSRLDGPTPLVSLAVVAGTIAVFVQWGRRDPCVRGRGRQRAAVSPVPIAAARSSVILTVDTASGVPPYEQIREQVSRMIASGVLPPAGGCPRSSSSRTTSSSRPAPSRARYKELEREGLVVSQRRKGTIVADRPARAAPTREIREELDAAIERFVLQVRQLGAEPDEALDRAQALLDSGRLAS